MCQLSLGHKPFNAEVVQKCLQLGATISSAAITHGITANAIREWQPVYRNQSATALPVFGPIRATPKRPDEALEVIGLPIGEKSITVKWQTSDPEGCTRFIRELTQ